MNISDLFIINFRNYSQLNLNLNHNLNIFIGDNAQGKTNILEAIHFLATTRSFRTQNSEYLIKSGENISKISSIFIKNNIKNSISYTLLPRKEMWFNNNQIKKASNYIGKLNISILCPEDSMLVKGDASYRRRFMDLALCQVDKEYCHAVNRYYKIVKQKNALLKEIKFGKERTFVLDPWDEQVRSLIPVIVSKRRKFITFIAKQIAIIQNLLTSEMEPLVIKYQENIPGLREGEESEFQRLFQQAQSKARPEEIQRGMTLLGPHRDELLFYIHGMNIKQFGSQGQQRTAVISLRLAEIEYLYTESGDYPILLVDDIFSELDDKRKEHLLKLLDRNTQLFITGTREADFPELLDKAKIFRVAEGKVT